MGIGAYRHLVTLEHPSGVVYPTTWYCALQPVSAQVADGLAAYFIRGRYHPGITLETQINWEGRTFQVQGIADLDERHTEIQITAVEVVARGKALDRGPYILQQPIGTVMLSTSSWTLEVEAGGTPPLSYQWMADGVIIPGATGQNYVTGPLDETTVFSVRVSNAYGFVTSMPATVTVVYAPVILEQPEDVTIEAGESTVLEVVAEGTAPLVYQWIRDGVDIPGATSSTYDTGPLEELGTIAYAVRVANGYGVVTSDPAIVTVESATLTYQEQVIADGVVAYWPLDDPSGTTARDLVGTRHGTISGGVTLNQPGVGTSKAMTFDGTGKILTPVESVTVPATCSFECWVNTAASARAFFSGRTAGGFDTLLLYIGTVSSGAARFYGNAEFAGIRVVTDSQWHHVVGVQTGTAASIYVDGALDNSLARTFPSDTGQLSLGFDLVENYGLIGTLQDCAMYNRALTPAEILTHYELRLAGTR